MMAKFSLSLLLICTLLIPCSAETQGALRWITARQSAGEFENVLFHYLQSQKLYQIRSDSVQPADLVAELNKINPAEQKGHLAVECTLKTYESLLRNPETGALLDHLGLRLMNPRLFSVPFYILSFSDDTGNPESLQVAFITLPTEETQSIQEADLVNLLSEVLARPRNAIKVYRERDAYTAAKSLYSGTYRMVGIYEDEPSILMDEFNINLTQELRAKPPHALSLAQTADQYHEVAPERLGYVYYTGNDPLGSGKRLVLLGLTQQTKEQFPVILTNLPNDQVGSLELALSYAYFLGLPSDSQSIASDKDRSELERAYLYNSYADDPGNRMKGIGFVSYLMLMRSRSANNAARQALFDDKLKLFLKTVQLEKVTSQTVFDWLGVKVPKLDKRLLFTDDVSRIYQEALSRIDQASKASGETRLQKLQEARDDLIAAILHDDQPGDIKGSRGLWSIQDYNPYYQLARVTLYLEMEGRK